MTHDDARRLRVLLHDLFPAGDRDPAAADLLLTELGEFPTAMVDATVRSMARAGREWCPTPSQIRAHLVELGLDLPRWGAVLGAMHAQRRQHGERGTTTRWDCPHGQCDGDGLVVDEHTRLAKACACRADVIRQRRQRGTVHAVLAAWLDTTAPAKIQAALEGDTTAEAQLRDSWREWCADISQLAARRGLDPAGLAALKRAEAGRPQRDELTRGTAMTELVAGLRPVEITDSASEAA